jgi:hypothetical protein
MAPSRRAAAAALALAAALCVAHVLGSAASASAGLLGGVTLDPAAPFGLRADLVAGLDGGDAHGAGARGSRLLRAAGAGGALGAALQAALDAAGVPPRSRLHAAHATGEQAPFLRNWARHARVQRIPHLTLLALDADAAAAGDRLGLLTFKCVLSRLTRAARAARSLTGCLLLRLRAWRRARSQARGRAQQPCTDAQRSCAARPCSVPELLLKAGLAPARTARDLNSPRGAFSTVLPLLQALLAIGHNVLLSESDVARALHPLHTGAPAHARVFPPSRAKP